jgi:hypothetical protein
MDNLVIPETPPALSKREKTKVSVNEFWHTQTSNDKREKNVNLSNLFSTAIKGSEEHSGINHKNEQQKESASGCFGKGGSPLPANFIDYSSAKLKSKKSNKKRYWTQEEVV